MRLFLFSFFCLLIIVTSCGKRSSFLETPIPADTLILLMADIHLGDAVGNIIAIRHSEMVPDTIKINPRILLKYGYTKEQYDSTMAIYSRNPDKLIDLYNLVIANLSMREALLVQQKNKADSILKAEKELKDSIAKLDTLVTKKK